VGLQLTTKGWSRAKALPSLFSHEGLHDFGDPVALYAMKPGSDDGSLRPEETLKYLGEELKLKIHEDNTIDDYGPMVKEIMHNHDYDGKMVVVCWEHNVLEDIAVAFGVDPKPHYGKTHFDRAWLLTFTGGSVRFQDLPQKLLPFDDTD
jgi:hypothetical protein